ncbi:hypothetical protein PYCCODRAFT_1437796 [Trametes coccinea BRFM310]|uniref:Uncharacterized protein n=1 Tax=Trametes coccinea (strain BRFM310) TaxID=1353009 RepID=A0A1Y2IJE1_TRAC3|nr:hypothetical protein PYCCODRAFT_1437796 [Trametes coccinea BRFM310]
MLPTSLAGLPDHIPHRTLQLSPIPVDASPPSIEGTSLASPIQAEQLPPPLNNTKPNRFGVFRRFSVHPVHDPEEDLTIDAFTDPHATFHPSASHPSRTPLHAFGRQVLQTVQSKVSAVFAPFANITIFRIMHWLYSGSPMKSAQEVNHLIREAFLAPEFSIEHLADFDANRENHRLDAYSDDSGTFSASDGWRRGEIRIGLPKERVHHTSEEEAPQLNVPGIYHRSLLEVLKAACQDASANAFHWIPFHLFHRSSSGHEERLFGDAYTADGMNEEHEKIQAKARDDREPGDAADLEYVVVPIMISSDSTHLTSFGQASLWPIYVAFANLSKYIRACPSAFALHHLAYIPSLPLSVQTAYQEAYGEPASAAVLRFCKRELMQKIWLLLLDDEFIHAYVHGIVITCGDGIMRRVFPRILTYSADYPEKCLIACIKFLARCPCPDCLVDKGRVHLMGSRSDMRTRTTRRRTDTGPLQVDIASARRSIFCFGAPPEGSAVEGILGATSTTPTRSAFSARLAQYGFQVYQLLVPDLLHEFELGVWKATITHIVRILIAAGGRYVQEFDARFSQIPTFGRSTIRSFGHNTSGFKKLAARDYEDLLQCALPVLEGLLPARFNTIILDLIFLLATWHALAKLRLHSETTLLFLEQTAASLGIQMRTFSRVVCNAYDTRELPKETIARARRKAATHSKGSSAAATSTASAAASSNKRKIFNLNTYKFHRLADYPWSIRRWGTTDNYTTQTSELEHRRVKRFYARTNKNKDFVWQITRHQRRETILNRIRRRALAREAGSAIKAPQAETSRRRSRSQYAKTTPYAPTSASLRPLHLRFEQSEPLPASSPRDHTQISEEQAHPVDIHQYVNDNQDDPAFEGFVHKLQVHVFSRLRAAAQAGEGPDSDSEVSSADLRRLRILRNRMYLQKVMRVNYTSYDMRREQDSVNPRSHPDIMMLAPSEHSHPYLYARVVSIFHVNATIITPNLEEEPEAQLLHVLWVRWFDLDNTVPAGFAARRPYRLRFAGLDDDPFTFIAPSQVLRGVHILPAFHYGRSNAALPYPSIIRGGSNEVDDFVYYYVGMWSDRDLFMRLLGGGIGHRQSYTPFTGYQASAGVDDDDPAAEGSELATGVGSGPGGLDEPSSSSEDDDPEEAYYPSTDDEIEGEEGPEQEEDAHPGCVDMNAEDGVNVEDIIVASDLGPEDGDGEYAMDDLDSAGFAPL